MPVYRSDDQWRTVLIVNLVRLRQAIYDVGAAAACIALGAALNGLWDGFRRRRCHCAADVGEYVAATRSMMCTPRRSESDVI